MRKPIIKIYLTLIITLLLIFLVTCARRDSRTIELNFWVMGAEGEHIGTLLPEFERQHPGITVKTQTIPWGAAHEKLLTAFAGRSTPDVCQLGNTWIPEFRALDALVRLDSLVAASRIVTPEAYFPGIWNTNVIGDGVYGIPWYVDTRLLFYRKDILKQAGYNEPPQDWEQWMEMSRKIVELSPEDQRRYAIFLSLIFNDWQVPAILIMNNDGPLLKDNNCYGAFDDPRTVEALRFYLSFFQQGLASRTMTEIQNIYQGFSSGFFSMMITGPWNVSEMRTRAPELESRWSTAPMPFKRNRNSVAGGASLIIFKNTLHKEAAWKLIEYLSRPDIQRQFFLLTRDLPAVKETWTSQEIKADPEMEAFYTQLLNVQATPKISEWEQVAVKIQEHMETAIFGKSSLEQSIERLNRDVDKILEKRRWLLSHNLIAE
ncbi:sugar ABC transporter substrate-binding protein [candidate division KSB1 bacterium]|nr:sugar ABC transporter substrate-binding protein [candidate division KSB1 bacterium]